MLILRLIEKPDVSDAFLLFRLDLDLTTSTLLLLLVTSEDRLGAVESVSIVGKVSFNLYKLSVASKGLAREEKLKMGGCVVGIDEVSSGFEEDSGIGLSSVDDLLNTKQNF